MAYDGYIVYDGVEIINVARTARLARTIGVNGVRIDSRDALALTERVSAHTGFGLGPFGLGPFGLGMPVDPHYEDVTESPWYDDAYPASAEFAGVLPIDIRGLDDSSLVSSPTEYITDGGNTGAPRNATQSFVCNLLLVGSTERGVEYGRRWLARVLTGGRKVTLCGGSDLYYYRDNGVLAERVHRRDVALTRSLSVTNKRVRRCSAALWVNLTLTAGDPFEYGDPVDSLTSLGANVATGPGVTSFGSLTDVQQTCPAYDYSPIYDPLYPALVAPPAPPDFLPAGWTIKNGDTFFRRWAEVTPVEPTNLLVVPLIKVVSTTEARMVRVSVWGAEADVDEQCLPLFSVVISYLPANFALYIDGEQRVAYFWDGASTTVRRADSLVYAPDANPVEWTSFNDAEGLRVTLDTFAKTGGGYEGNGNVRVSMSLLAKSD